MKSIEFAAGPFSSNEQRNAVTEAWKARYTNIVFALNDLGSEVRHFRTLERGDGVDPYNIVVEAAHEYVFPPQQCGVVEHYYPRVIGPDLHSQTIIHSYNPQDVKAHIRLEYARAQDKVALRVFEVMQPSVIPDEVSAILEQTRAASLELYPN